MSEITAEETTSGAREDQAAGASPRVKSGDFGSTTKIEIEGLNRQAKKVGESPIFPLLLIGAGAYLMWFGVKYWRGTGAASWPTYVVKSALQGKGIPPNIPAPPPGTQVTAYEQGIQAQAAGAGGAVPGGTPGGPAPTGNAQNMAKLLLGRYGWAPTEMGPLILLWNQESGWRNCAFNVSGAYGIAQALGHGSAACATGPRCVGASSPGLNCAYGGYGQSQSDSQAANAGNTLKQIEWGLNYIKSTYGTPSAAWAHEKSFGWY